MNLLNGRLKAPELTPKPMDYTTESQSSIEARKIPWMGSPVTRHK